MTGREGGMDAASNGGGEETRRRHLVSGNLWRLQWKVTCFTALYWAGIMAQEGELGWIY
jgi:hypothetical protein